MRPTPRDLGVLAALAAFRVALPLAVLAASGSELLPGFPRYDYLARPGDAHGYYAAVRELLSTPPRLSWALPVVALALGGVVVAAFRWRRRPSERPLSALLAVWCVATIATLFVLRMRSSGAPTIGWPFAWSVPLFPYRGLGLPLDPDIAFGFGLAVSLLSNTVTLVATYLLGIWTTGRRSIGLLAATLFGLWPLLGLVLSKTSESGTWLVDLGLLVYSEPVSTALVATAMVLLVGFPAQPLPAVFAGALLGFSVSVRLSNAVIAVCVVVLLALWGERRSAVLVSLAGLAFLPLTLAYWDMGYPTFEKNPARSPAFSPENVIPAWRDSVLWGAKALVVLVPPAILGALAVPRRYAALLGAWILSTVVFYTFYSYTPIHPRFFLVALPAVFVLWAAGALAVRDRVYGSFIRRP